VSLRPEQKGAFIAEAQNARTVDELSKVAKRADVTDKAEQMHADSLAQTKALSGIHFADKGLEANGEKPVSAAPIDFLLSARNLCPNRITSFLNPRAMVVRPLILFDLQRRAARGCLKEDIVPDLSNPFLYHANFYDTRSGSNGCVFFDGCPGPGYPAGPNWGYTHRLGNSKGGNLVRSMQATFDH
jgi:hypothetical protein